MDRKQEHGASFKREMLSKEMSRRDFLTLVLGEWILGGMVSLRVLSEIGAYVEAREMTDLRNGDKVSFGGRGSYGWDGTNTLELIGPDSGNGIIKPGIGESPLHVHKRDDGEEVVMVRVELFAGGMIESGLKEQVIPEGRSPVDRTIG